MQRQFVVYIMSNKRNGTLYIGVTNNLPRRIFEHRATLPRLPEALRGLQIH